MRAIEQELGITPFLLAKWVQEFRQARPAPLPASCAGTRHGSGVADGGSPASALPPCSRVLREGLRDAAPAENSRRFTINRRQPISCTHLGGEGHATGRKAIYRGLY
jgi:hypothetical protein